jgi:hypothetical protein
LGKELALSLAPIVGDKAKATTDLELGLLRICAHCAARRRAAGEAYAAAKSNCIEGVRERSR